MTKSYLIFLSTGSRSLRLWLYIDWQSLQKVICDMKMDSNRHLVGIGFLAAQEWHSQSNIECFAERHSYWKWYICWLNTAVGLNSVIPISSFLCCLSRLHCVLSHVSALHNTILVLLSFSYSFQCCSRFPHTIQYIFYCIRAKHKEWFLFYFVLLQEKTSIKSKPWSKLFWFSFNMGKGMLGLVCTHPRFCLILVFHTLHQVMNKLNLTMHLYNIGTLINSV